LLILSILLVDSCMVFHHHFIPVLISIIFSCSHHFIPIILSCSHSNDRSNQFIPIIFIVFPFNYHFYQFLFVSSEKFWFGIINSEASSLIPFHTFYSIIVPINLLSISSEKFWFDIANSETSSLVPFCLFIDLHHSIISLFFICQ
jgi:hypothetical protein